MHDYSLIGLISTVAGSSIMAQATAASVPLPIGALVSGLSMAAAAFVAWGMFKKSNEHHEREITLLRQSLDDIQAEVSIVSQRVARIEGRLETLQDMMNQR
jgi:hypothetical protein